MLLGMFIWSQLNRDNRPQRKENNLNEVKDRLVLEMWRVVVSLSEEMLSMSKVWPIEVTTGKDLRDRSLKLLHGFHK